MNTFLAQLQSWLKQSLRFKILAMAIVPMIVIQTVVAVVAFVAYSKISTDLVIKRDRDLVNLTAARLESLLAADSQHINHLADQTQQLVAPVDAEALAEVDGNAVTHNILLDATGIVVRVNPEQPAWVGQDWSQRGEVVQVLQTLEASYSNLVIDETLGGTVLVGAYPVLDDEGGLTGIWLETIPVGSDADAMFTQKLAQLLQPDTGKAIYLVDGNGRVIYHTNAGYTGDDFSTEAVVQQVLGGSAEAVFTRNVARQEVIASFSPVPGTTWGLVIEDDWATITRNQWGYQAVLLFLLALGVIAPAIVVALGIRRLTWPIEALTSAAQQVAAGDFAQAINVHTGDEIEALANQFNQMAVELHASYSHLEQKVEERTAELVAASRAKSVFLANMSHELRTPLNAILGYSQLMERDPHVTPDQRDCLETIGRSGEHLLGLINDVLTMSKIEAGRTVLQENAFDLHRQLEALGEIFSPRADDKHLHLIVDIAPNVPVYIQADEGKLRQVLMNLLSNAIKFTVEGGVTLRVGVRNAAGADPMAINAVDSETVELCFEVEDTGVGIAPDEMNLLFEPFVQTSSGKNSKEGTGLGLPIGQQFVRLMQGELHVTSVLGKGSCFRFALPVKLADPDTTAIQRAQTRRRVVGWDADTTPKIGRPYRLLVVEDQATNRNLLVKLLAPFGFDIQCATNGLEGIETWQQWQPDLIWMDMRMPVMDGYEATRRIKNEAESAGQKVIVVALTASAFEEERAAILQAGCDAFLRKPFREIDIFDVLTEHLGVHFTYEESELPAPRHMAKSEDNQQIAQRLSNVLADLPPGWPVALHQATLQLDAEQMMALLEPLQLCAPHLAQMMSQWIKNFEYEKICALITQFIPAGEAL